MDRTFALQPARKLASLLLAFAVAVSLAWPGAALAAEPGDTGEGTGTGTAAEQPANPGEGEGGDQPAGPAGPENPDNPTGPDSPTNPDNPAGEDPASPADPDTPGAAVEPAPEAPSPSQEAVVPAPQKKALKITGLKTAFTKTPKQTVSDAIKVSPAAKHTVLLQRYNAVTQKWSTKATFTTKADGTVTLKYPAQWRKANSSTWRVAVKATDRYERCISKQVQITTKNRSSVKLSAKSAVIVDAETGQTYFTKNENVKRQNASTTKMMTALLALENNKLSDRVTITAEAANTPYSNLGGRGIGQVTTVKNLLYFALLPSDNGAAKMLGLHTGGTEKRFVSMMNKRAKELGCTNTSFKNPHGLTQKGHGTTAHDLALIAREALKNPTFKKIVGTKRYSFRTQGGERYQMESTNKLLGKVKGVHGAKTGYTDAAGHCFVGAFKYKGHTYLTVVLGSPTSDKRWNDTKALIRYVKKWF